MDKEVELRKFLKKYPVIGLDSQIFIYHFENNPVFRTFTMSLFNLMEQREIVGVTSILSILEIIVKPKEKEDTHLVSEYKFLLNTFPNLVVGAVDEDVVDLAASLKAKYSFETTIAVQLATAKLYDAACFITNNQDLKKIQEIKVIIISDILEKVKD
ncbi:MAG: type II toxin-antitoxin system VapC family toxin [bacterium]